MDDKSHFDNIENETNSHDSNNNIDFTELDAKMEELVYAIRDFTINNSSNTIKEATKTSKQQVRKKQPIKKLDVDKIRKAIMEATEIAKKRTNKKEKKTKTK